MAAAARKVELVRDLGERRASSWCSWSSAALVVWMNNSRPTRDPGEPPEASNIDTETGAIAGRRRRPDHVDTYIDFMCPVCNQFEQAYGETIQGLVDDGTITLEHPPDLDPRPRVAGHRVLDARRERDVLRRRGGRRRRRSRSCRRCTRTSPRRARPVSPTTRSSRSPSGVGVDRDRRCVNDGKYSEFVTAMTEKTPVAAGRQRHRHPDDRDQRRGHRELDPPRARGARHPVRVGLWHASCPAALSRGIHVRRIHPFSANPPAIVLPSGLVSARRGVSPVASVPPRRADVGLHPRSRRRMPMGRVGDDHRVVHIDNFRAKILMRQELLARGVKESQLSSPCERGDCIDCAPARSWPGATGTRPMRKRDTCSRFSLPCGS